MRAVDSLSENYKEYYSVDLQRNKKMALLVNGIAIIIGVVMALPMLFLVPISALFDVEKGLASYVLRFASIFVLTVLYMVLHELVHGIAMKICGTKKVKYGFTGLYAFAGSDDYYDKRAYIFIALAPVVLWGAVLALVNALVPIEWFWVIYIIQIFNVSGAAGDFFVTARFSRFPADVLIKDHGVGMTVYIKD